MIMNENKEKLRAFLSRFFRNHDLQEEEDIFALGFVNSLFVMELVQFVEKAFQIKIEDADLDVENFRTIKAIVRFVEHKKAPLTETR